MSKRQLQLWEVIAEIITIIAVLIYLGMQIYYHYIYETTWDTMLYHLLPVAIIYAGMLVLQIYPELINVGGGEPLKGMVRVYAIRMIRNSKLLFVLGMLFPSAADALGIGMDGAYSLLIMGGILGIIGYYLYRIYRYNVNQTKK